MLDPYLKRLSKKQLLASVTKGLWANTAHPYFIPLAVVPFLLGQEQGYVSFLTALHLHGLMSQIPSAFQIATTGTTREVSTPFGTFEFHKLCPQMMRSEVYWSERHPRFRIASAEKALLDTLYLSTRKGKRFEFLPEVDLAPRLFNRKHFRALLLTIPYAPIRKAIEKRFENLG